MVYSDSLDDLFEVLQEQEVMCFRPSASASVAVAPTRRKVALARSLSSSAEVAMMRMLEEEAEAEAEERRSMLCSAVEAAAEINGQGGGGEVRKF